MRMQETESRWSITARLPRAVPGLGLGRPTVRRDLQRVGERRLGEGRRRNWGERAEGRLGTLESPAEAEGSMERAQAEAATLTRPAPHPPRSGGRLWAWGPGRVPGAVWRCPN